MTDQLHNVDYAPHIVKGFLIDNAYNEMEGYDKNE